MSYSKPLPHFIYDLLRYFNRDQLERISIVCRPFKNIIDRYFNSKPYRIFDELEIREGLYSLNHNFVQWHPNRDDYSVQQFLAGQKCYINKSERSLNGYTYYSFAEMRPYFGSSVRINVTVIDVAKHFISNPELIKEMESIAYLWRVGVFGVMKTIVDAKYLYSQINAEDLEPILNSPTILQCRYLFMRNAHFSFKHYKILYAVDVIGIGYKNGKVDPDFWLQFLEQPGAKPVVVLYQLHRESIDNVLDYIFKAFSSAVSPNAFKIVFIRDDEELTVFRETNKSSGEILELKKGLPVEYQTYWDLYHEDDQDDCYTLERTRI